MSDFVGFPKLARLNRNCSITEKIDGTNAQVVITLDYEEAPPEAARCGGYTIRAGSRTRWITPMDDNFGFATWVWHNREELITLLGAGQHFGEWWGRGIQRGYGLEDRRFSLFNAGRWEPKAFEGTCVSVVPLLYQGPFHSSIVQEVCNLLRQDGSYAAKGFKDPEGVVVFHEASRNLFKVTLSNDAKPKGSKE